VLRREIEEATKMSYCGAMPVELDAIDSRIVESCLMRVRAEAGLDEEAVLPPLDVLVPPCELVPPVQSARLVVGASALNLPSAEAIVRAAVKPAAASPHASASNRDETTARPRRRASIVQRMRWPVFLCGFVAGVCGGVALMKSPVGKQPVVQRAARTVHNGAVNALAATAAAKSRIVDR
jgi:hypothetical protein